MVELQDGERCCDALSIFPDLRLNFAILRDGFVILQAVLG